MASEGTSTSSHQDKMEATQSAVNILAQGKRNMVCGEIPIAVNQFQEACQLLSKAYGETAKECAEAYFCYGQALLDLARMENGVLGNALQGVPETDDESTEQKNEQFEKADLDEKERDKIRHDVYDAMSEKETEKAEREKKEAEKNKDAGETMEIAMDTEEGEKKPVNKETEAKKDEKVDKKDPKEEKSDEKNQKEEKKDEMDKKEEKKDKMDKKEEKKDEKNKKEEKMDEMDKKEEKKDKMDKKEEKKDEKNQKEEKMDEMDKKEEKNDEMGKKEEKKDEKIEDQKMDEAKSTKEDKKPVDEKAKDEKKTKKDESSEKDSTEDGEDEAEEGTEEEGTEEEGEGTEEEAEAEGKAKEDEGEETTSQDGSQEGENPDDVSNLQLAWEMLELAKLIYQKDESKEAKLRVAESHLKLGEVSLETEQYEEAIKDFNICLGVQKEHLEPDNRLLAETYYQLGLGYSFHKLFKESVESYQAAIKVIEARIDNLNKNVLDKATTEEKESKDFDTPVYKANKEVGDLKELIPDIKSKIEDVEDEKKNMDDLKNLAKEALGGIAAISEKPASSGEAVKEAPASDISHLIKRKRKSEDTEEDKAKKPKQENGEGDAPPAVNGDTAKEEKPEAMETKS